MRTFEILEYGDEYMDAPPSAYRAGPRPNGYMINADRYELRQIATEYGSTDTVISFYVGDNEVATLFRLPRMIRALPEEA